MIDVLWNNATWIFSGIGAMPTKLGVMLLLGALNSLQKGIEQISCEREFRWRERPLKNFDVKRAEACGRGFLLVRGRVFFESTGFTEVFGIRSMPSEVLPEIFQQPALFFSQLSFGAPKESCCPTGIASYLVH